MKSIVMKRAISFALLAAFVVAGALANAADVQAEMYYKGKDKAKYVFLFIGDGMGLPQVTATEAYLTEGMGETYKPGAKLVMNTFPAQGVTTTHANNRFITGSAASATALGCGAKTDINMLGQLPDGKAIKSIAEIAKEKGKKVGVISSVSIDHATPAAFYSHVATRKMLHEINWAMTKSGFDFFGGGGMSDPTGKKSKKPMGDAMAEMKKQGYTVFADRAGFDMVDPKKQDKVYTYSEWLQDAQALPYDMDRRGEMDISLAEFTKKGIEFLYAKDKADKDKGFFMMVEAGKIDWACHANDAAGAINDTVAFDMAIKEAVEFAKNHKDETLIVVTGDHECGGLTLGFAGTKYGSAYSLIAKQKGSFMMFEEAVKAYKEMFPEGRSLDMMADTIENNFGIKLAELESFEYEQVESAFWRSMAGDKSGRKGEDYLIYGGYDPLTVTLTRLMNSKAGLSWTSYSHTGVPVATMAWGLGAESFNGYYDNTEVAKKIMAVMGVKPNVYIVEKSDEKTKLAAN